MAEERRAMDGSCCSAAAMKRRRWPWSCFYDDRGGRGSEGGGEEAKVC